ncbi:RNA-directed DNA polymerase from mobile element jockey [Trichonephila clavipes]|nr:RNA-directed DNA polymerase from mobile element jockey [Trichonephila clavipes]
MASSTECSLFPKPRKGTGKSAAENKKRNEIIRNNSPLVIPGLSFAQVLNPDKSQQMAAQGKASSASKETNNQPKNNTKETVIMEAINSIQNEPNENDRTHPDPGRGGTAILIKNNISHYHVSTPPLLTGVEATLITITPIDYDPILIGLIYFPAINNYFRNLGAALDAIFNFNNKTTLVGDFNAKHTSWGCHCSDTRGNIIYSYIVNNSIDVLAPPTPTRFGISSASIIDYALIKNLNWPCTINSIPELSSDHNPIKLHFPRTSKFELPPPQLNTTWNIFTKNFANNDNLYFHEASSTHEIESQVRELTSEILIAHEKASKPVNHSELPFVQGELKHLFKERNRARKLWPFTRHPQHKTELNNYKKLSKEKLISTDNKYGRITLPLWTLKTAPFGELQKRSDERPPRFQPLMARQDKRFECGRTPKSMATILTETGDFSGGRSDGIPSGKKPRG